MSDAETVYSYVMLAFVVVCVIATLFYIPDFTSVMGDEGRRLLVNGALYGGVIIGFLLFAAWYN